MISYACCSSEAIAWPTLEMCVLFHVLLSTRMVLQMEDILRKGREIQIHFIPVCHGGDLVPVVPPGHDLGVLFGVHPQPPVGLAKVVEYDPGSCKHENVSARFRGKIELGQGITYRRAIWPRGRCWGSCTPPRWPRRSGRRRSRASWSRSPRRRRPRSAAAPRPPAKKLHIKFNLNVNIP